MRYVLESLLCNPKFRFQELSGWVRVKFNLNTQKIDTGLNLPVVSKWIKQSKMLISQKFKLQDDNAGCGTAKNALSGCRKEHQAQKIKVVSL